MGGRLVAVAAVLCLGASAAGCGSASREVREPPAGAPARSSTAAAAQAAISSATASPAVSSRPAKPSAASSDEVSVIDLAAPGLGLVGLSSGGQVPGSARLLLSTDYGRSFTAIGPATSAATVVDGVFFLNRRDGWLTVWNVNTTAETLYRTTDGGRSWRAFAAPEHDAAAGSSDTVQFVTPTRGWLLAVQPTAPSEILAATSDGGARWRVVARNRARAPGSGQLPPELGDVRFGPDSSGWLGGGMFSQALFRTGNGGRTWLRVSIKAPRGALFGLPAAVGRILIEPVTAGHELLLYRSTDGGAHWSQHSVLPHVTNGSCGAEPPAVSIPAPGAVWAAGVRANRAVVYRTTDGGLRWTGIGTNWRVPGRCGAPEIQAANADHAWVLIPATGYVYATRTGGRTWQQINSALASAARAGR
jgi:photosystem II stability/assembly factor-like uncharacterized protein